MSDEEFERALDLFIFILEEHIQGNRCVTRLTIALFEDKLRIVEDVEFHD
jgi:hypothetical protein